MSGVGRGGLYSCSSRPIAPVIQSWQANNSCVTFSFAPRLPSPKYSYKVSISWAKSAMPLADTIRAPPLMVCSLRCNECSISLLVVSLRKVSNSWLLLSASSLASSKNTSKISLSGVVPCQEASMSCSRLRLGVSSDAASWTNAVLSSSPLNSISGTNTVALSATCPTTKWSCSSRMVRSAKNDCLVLWIISNCISSTWLTLSMIDSQPLLSLICPICRRLNTVSSSPDSSPILCTPASLAPPLTVWA